PTDGLNQIPKDTPSVKMWPVANMLIAASMGASIIVAFHLLRLVVSIIPISGINLLSWAIFLPAICFASFLAGIFCAFSLRNLEGRPFTTVQNAFAGAISGLIGSIVGVGLELLGVGLGLLGILTTTSSMGDVLTNSGVIIMIGGATSIMSALFAAVGGAAFTFISKK
ncbi:hypothetical protein COV61_03570, partial [Candidatus Micrarchaeota archaeon CG11_big_fil_rev_8_21_14_0_20_47_5]